MSRGYGSTNRAATSRSSLSSSPLSQRAVCVLLLVGWGVGWDNKQGETGQSHSLYVCFCLVRTHGAWCIWASVLSSRSVFECVCYLLARTLASMCELRLDCDRPPSSHNSSPTVRENNCHCPGPIPKITKKGRLALLYISTNGGSLSVKYVWGFLLGVLCELWEWAYHKQMQGDLGTIRTDLVEP